MEEKQMQKQEEIMPTFAVSIDEVQRRFTELQGFIKSQMVEGEDYGKIPGCQKPSLFKPGAEKLATLYGLSPRLEVIEKVTDWDKGFFYYMIKCTLVSKRSGFIVAEGIGSCNSREKRYKNQDGYTLDNTILKMAKKRALVDAVLTATRTSGLFTQDVEDIMDVNGHAETPPTQVTPEHHQEAKPSGDMASDKQRKAVYAICKSKGLLLDDVLSQHDVESLDALTKSDASTIIDWLQKQ